MLKKAILFVDDEKIILQSLKAPIKKHFLTLTVHEALQSNFQQKKLEEQNRELHDDSENFTLNGLEFLPPWRTSWSQRLLIHKR